ncbi:hypothetical protein Y032_0006g2796 [Ancylostoma ceylanicum]|uniref:Uncharacterized protein n=1 Tax=Ancylostoma ceylanicum TaxID=53326 RepID=A0A016VNZ5_9BILA|nr:hypothetical protein Y032_0006g2796 [Ancylostoma ceylanicum]
MREVIRKMTDRKDDLSLKQMAKQLNISRKSVQMTVKNELGLWSYRLLSGQILADQAKQNWKEKRKKLREFFKVRRIEDSLRSDEKAFTVEDAKNSESPPTSQPRSQEQLQARNCHKKSFSCKLNGLGQYQCNGQDFFDFYRENRQN